MAVDVGQTAPDFTLYDTDRKQRSLSEFKGKNLVLAFFPGAFSGVCTKEACTLRDRMDEFNSMNAQVVGISIDSPGVQKTWAEQNNVKFTFLSDFNRDVVKQYGVNIQNFGGMEGFVAANRAVLVLDKNGVVQFKWVAPNPGTEPNYDEVREAVGKLK